MDHERGGAAGDHDNREQAQEAGNVPYWHTGKFVRLHIEIERMQWETAQLAAGCPLRWIPNTTRACSCQDRGSCWIEFRSKKAITQRKPMQVYISTKKERERYLLIKRRSIRTATTYWRGSLVAIMRGALCHAKVRLSPYL